MNRRIRNKIFGYMLVVSLIPLSLIYWYISSNYYDNLRDNVLEQNLLLQQSSVNEAEALLEKIEFASNQCFDLSVQELIAMKAESLLETYNNQQAIERSFRVNLELFEVFDVVDYIHISTMHGNDYYITKYNYEIENISSDFVDRDRLYENFKYQSYDRSGEQYIYSRIIKSVGNKGDELGIVQIVFQREELLKRFENYTNGQQGMLQIENANGEILYTNMSKSSDEAYTQYGNPLRYQLKNSELTLTFYNDMDRLLEPVSRLQQITLFIMIGSGVIIILIALFLADTLTRPIKKLLHGTHRMSEGEFDVLIPVESKDELGELCEAFNFMADKINVMVNDVLTAQLSEKEAVISALTAQINPHFLYNTLDMVKSMAEIEGQDEIGRITKALSGIFRYSTKNDVLQVKVREELDNLLNYISIIDARFGGKIDFDLNVREDVYQYEMIKLCLQPMVENSVSHGLSERGYDGRIGISIYSAQDLLYIIVKDNGQGVEESVLGSLQEDLANGALVYTPEHVTNHTSVGLRNINKRIKLYYGNDYGVSIDSQYLEGTVVTIRIPLQS